MSAAILIAAVLLGQAPVAQVQCLDLEAVGEIAATTDPGVATAVARLMGAEANFDDALALRRPNVEMFARTAAGDSGLSGSQIENQIGLRASQRLLDFGDARLAREGARSSRRAAALDVRATAADAGLEAILLVIDRIEALARLEATLQRAAYFREQASAVSSMADQGLATGAELAEIEAEVSRSEADRIELEFQRDRVDTALSIRLERPAPALCPGSRLGSDLSQALGRAGSAAIIADRAASVNPRLAALRAEVQASDAQRRRESRARLPAIDAVGIASYAYDDARDAWNYRDRIGIDVSVPLYSGSALSARADRARAQADLAAAQLRRGEREVREQALVHLRRIASLQGRVIRLESVREHKGDQLALIEQQVARSVSTLPDLVDVRLEYEDAVLAEINARHTLYREQARLLALADASPGTPGAPALRPQRRIWGWEPSPQD
jgi:protease secretion system outer membrane protein